MEVAGALAELLDVAVRHDGFRFPRRPGRIILVDGLDRLLTPFQPSAAAYAARTLERTRRRAQAGAHGAIGERVLRGARRWLGSLTRTVVWAGGVSVENTVASTMGQPSGPNGRLVVEPDLSLPGHPDAYAIGDAAAVPWGPGTRRRPTRSAPSWPRWPSSRGGMSRTRSHAGSGGRPTQPFRYHDKGIMATIGRRAAITEFPRGLMVRGTLGWLAWLGLHILYLIGFRNKVVVLINWSWRYLSWGSGPRVIVGDVLERGPDDGVGGDQGGAGGGGGGGG